MDHEWLKLIEVSGPFIAEPVLRDVFPAGLDALESRNRQRIRNTYREWQTAVDDEAPDLEEIHAAWIEEVLVEALEMKADLLRRGNDVPERLLVDLPEHGFSDRPDVVLVDPSAADKPLFPIHTYGPDQDLHATVQLGSLAITPSERMITLLRQSGLRVGLVTNGECWMLVHAPAGAVTGLASWYARYWLQEAETLRAFVSLLGVSRFFGPDDEKLPALFERSVQHQDEVTDALGDQVERAVEVLVRTLDRADQDRNRELLAGVEPSELYEAGLTVMMRLVFLLAAEERGLLLLGDPRYDAFYAVSSLRGQLRREMDGVLMHRTSAWPRLLAVFRVVYGGLDHPTLRLPALGGSLFDPDRFPFLEGRTKGTNWKVDQANPLPIDDRTVLLLMEAIQVFKGRTLQYKHLDVEQIGHVYEGLLERTVMCVDEITLELKGAASSKNPSVTLGELEIESEVGPSELLKLLEDRTGRSATAIENDLEREISDARKTHLLGSCRGDEALVGRVLPYVELLETDPWDYPIVHSEGAFVVGLGQDRRDTGTHYTPKSLTEKIVDETLTPVVYRGPAEGEPRSDWKLKSPVELLDLKVCDPAMGSAAFLVQACRWLSERLVEAWSAAEGDGAAFNVQGEEIDKADVGSIEPLPSVPEDRATLARRLIAEKCLYGVDMNPLAVELAKLSIWLTTVAKGYPFGFLDHNLRVGNSLLGIDDLDQLTELSIEPEKKQQVSLFGRSIRGSVEKATEIRNRLRDIPIRDIHDVEMMAALDDQSRQALDLPIRIADAFVGIELAESNARTRNTRLQVLAGLADSASNGNLGTITEITENAEVDLVMGNPSGAARKTFHWPLEFPEVFGRDDGGFDAIVGNPPFLGGHRITGANGTAFRNWLVRVLAEGRRGAADLVAYFFLRAYQLLRSNSGFGLLAVNTIAEGDTRKVGLEPMLANGATIFAAYPNETWPGSAAVATSRVHVFNGQWAGDRVLLGRSVPHISAFLSDQKEWSPRSLMRNRGLTFEGNKVTGMGFVLKSDEAMRMLVADPRNKDVMFPFINGKDLNGDPEQKPSRWVINFWDWSEERAASYQEPYNHIFQEVKPERQRRKPDGEYALRSPLPELWWQHGEKRPGLYHAIGRGHHFENHPAGWDDSVSMDRVMVAVKTGKYLSVSIQPNVMVFSQSAYVFSSQDFALFANLNTTIHANWTAHHTATHETRLRYLPSDCFETFPLVVGIGSLTDLGRKYHERRFSAMQELGLGLTRFYNQFNAADISDPKIKEFRELQHELDGAVAKAYGWDDLDLRHDFHEVSHLPENDQVRFTISEEARKEILYRLGDLNRIRYQEEVDQGLHAREDANTPPLGKKTNPDRDQGALEL